MPKQTRSLLCGVWMVRGSVLTMPEFKCPKGRRVYKLPGTLCALEHGQRPMDAVPAHPVGHLLQSRDGASTARAAISLRGDKATQYTMLQLGLIPQSVRSVGAWCELAIFCPCAGRILRAYRSVGVSKHQLLFQGLWGFCSGFRGLGV